jgi:cyclophilin family peptidyl-prolyl cis-trans isomerase
MKNTFLIIVSIGLLFLSCKDDSEVITNPVMEEAKEQIVQIRTDFGDIHIYLFKGTPLHRENFLKLAQEGFYDSTEFHRIIPGFMIQGGDPNSKNDDRTDDGSGGPGYTIPSEIDSSKYKHKFGSIAAARLSDNVNPAKASSGCQFYLVLSESGTKHLNGNYTVYGQILDSTDVITEIGRQPRNGKNLPNTRIPMQVDVIELTPSAIKKMFNYDVDNGL